MNISLISFGRISDIINIRELELHDISSTDGLRIILEQSYPQLAEIKYKLALNQNIVQNDCGIRDGDCIALMPPFSGG
jgi:molybdopterin synthase sulfur carrier subunit